MILNGKNNGGMNNTTITIEKYSYSFDENRRELKDSKGNLVTADVRRLSDGEYSVIVDGFSFHLFLNHRKNPCTATVNNFHFDVLRDTLRDQLAKRLQKESGIISSALTVRAPMPGLIARVLVQEGTSVAAGDGILVVEAMKMENELKAQKSGLIKKIFIKEKQTVEKNDPLFIIE